MIACRIGRPRTSSATDSASSAVPQGKLTVVALTLS